MLIASLLGNRQGPPPASPAEDDSDFLAVVSGSPPQHSTSSGQPAAPELEAPLLLPAPSSPSLQPEEKEPPLLICQGLPSAREVMATVAAAIHRA